MHRQIENAERFLLHLLAVLLGLITLGVSIQVFMRYAASQSFLWGEELSIFAFVWCIYVGAAINVKRNDNFAFEFFSDLLEGRLAMAHRLLLNLIMLGCSAILAYQGTIFTVLSMKRYSPAVGISLLVPSLAVPLSAALMCIVLGLQIVLNMHELIRGNR